MALRKRGVTFLTCFRKRGYPEREGGGWGPSEKGGSNPGENYGIFIFLLTLISSSAFNTKKFM